MLKRRAVSVDIRERTVLEELFVKQRLLYVDVRRREGQTMFDFAKIRMGLAGRALATAAACLIVTGSAATGGESATEKLDLIRRIISERGEFDLAERELKSFVDENKTIPQAAEALVLLGYCQDKLRKNNDAAISYSQMVDQYPAAPTQLRVDAALGAADAFFRLGRYADAVRYYTNVIQFGGKPEQMEAALLWRAEGNYRLASAEIEAGRDGGELLVRAEKDFAQFIEKYPNAKLLPSALSGGGFAAFDAGDYEKALGYFRRFVRDFPSDRRTEENRYYIGESLYRMNQYDDARKAFREVLSKHSGGAFSAEARAGEAWADYGLGRIAEAAAGFEEAAKHAGRGTSEGLSYLYDAGCAWREAGEAQKAAEPLLAVAKASGHESNSLAWFRLGTLWQEQARAARERAEAATPGADRDRYRAMQKKLGEDAVQYFRRALAGGKLGDEELEANSLLGEVLLDAGRNADAVTIFADIAARWPDSERASWALYHQALAERELSQSSANDSVKRDHLSKAAAALKKSLGYPDARTRLQASWALADYLSILGDSDGAREQYRWLSSEGRKWAGAWRDNRGGGDPALENRARDYAGDSLFRLGESYYFANDYTRASGFYQEIIKQYEGTPQTAMAQLRLGEIAEAGKNVDAARQRYGEALGLAGKLGREKVGTTLGYAELRLGALLLRSGQKETDPAERRKILGEAAKNLAAVLAEPPAGMNVARPHYYLAEALYSLGQKKEALEEYEKSLELDPKGDLADAALFGAAWAKRDLGDSSGALLAVARVIDDFPASALRPEAFALAASIRRAGGDAQEALRDLDRFLSEYGAHPLAAKAELERASALDETGRHAEAAEAFRKFLENHPRHEDVPQALYQRSWSLWNQIRPKAEKVREAETKIREIEGGRLRSNLSAADQAEASRLEGSIRGLAAEVKTAEDEILSALRDLTERYPEYPVVDAAWLRIGEILYDRGDYQQALAAYQKALSAADARNGELADKAQYRMAWSIQRLADAAETVSLSDGLSSAREAARKDMWDRRVAAIDAFETIIGKYPNSDLVGDACFRAAELRRRSGQDNTDSSRRSAWFESAAQRYRQALEKGGEDAPYRQAAEYGDGLCLLLDGKSNEAREVFRKILLNPDGPYVQEAYWGLGQANLNLGAYADASQAFEQALSVDKGTEVAAKSRYGLGLTAAMAGDNARARLEYLAVDTLYSNYPEWAAAALVRAARTALEDGFRDKAIGDLERVLARYGETPAAEEAKELQASMAKGD